MAQSVRVGRTVASHAPAVAHYAARHRWLWWLVAAELVALALVLAGLGFEIRYRDRIYPGVSIAGVPVGGLSVEQARAMIEDGLPAYAPAFVRLRHGNQTWSIPVSDLGLSLGSAEAAARAYAVGRSAHLRQGAGARALSGPGILSLVAGLVEQWSAFLTRLAIPINFSVDEPRVTEQVRQFAAAMDLAPQEGQLKNDGGTYAAVPGQAGRRVDIAATSLALIQAIQRQQTEPVPLVIHEVAPAVRNLDEIAAQANLLASAAFTITVSTPDGPQSVALEPATVAEWLNLSVRRSDSGEPQLAVRLNRAPTEDYLRRLARQIERPSQDARLDFDPDKRQIVVLRPGQVGWSLDVAAGLSAIESALQRREQELSLAVRAVQPTVASDPLPAVDGIELIAEGTTTFAGSSEERIQNIVVGAEKFRGVVVPPGAEFSFNQYVGEINAANGFTEGLIIWGDRTAVGIGGGICQVSTTVFRAAFYAGFPITERTAHGYVVSWYGEPGLDATIYTPDVDLRFRNDTAGHLFIKPKVDLKTGALTFALYGQQQPRTVEMIGPQISNKRPAPPPLYQKDKSLPEGAIQQVDWAKEGQDVEVIRRIRAADGTVKEEKFESRYQPWRAVFLYGPGSDLPPGATGEGQD